MTLKEKVTLAAQPNRLYLFKEGVFYKAYNQNAMWFVQQIKRYNVTVKYIKKIQQEVFSIGFPITYLNTLNLKPFTLQEILVPASLSAGVYIVNVVSDLGTFHKKIVIE